MIDNGMRDKKRDRRFLTLHCIYVFFFSSFAFSVFFVSFSRYRGSLNRDKFVRYDIKSCQPCSGCPMRPCPPERSCPPKYICPPSSPYNICIIPPIPQKPSWKPCCVRTYGIPCNRHNRPERYIRFNNFDCVSQW